MKRINRKVAIAAIRAISMLAGTMCALTLMLFVGSVYGVITSTFLCAGIMVLLDNAIANGDC